MQAERGAAAAWGPIRSRSGSSTRRVRGTFAYGMAAAAVARIDVRFGTQPLRSARLLASPPVLGFGGRFWVASYGDLCHVVSAQAYAADGSSLGRVGAPEPPAAPRGEPASAPSDSCPPDL